MMRLQKYLAACGVASRRSAENMIAAGRVAVNGQTVTEMGTSVEEYVDEVTVDGNVVTLEERKVYILLSKPKGYVTTAQDTHGRPTVLDLVDVPERVFPVGRLDLNTEGLLILTNDGEFANHMMHPKYECEKTYFARLAEPLGDAEADKLRHGVWIEEEQFTTSPATVVRRDANKFSITIREGKKRQVRRMFEAVGGKVLYLRRTAIGKLRDTDLEKGKWRYLTDEEVRYLLEYSGTGRD
ncbi:MAG: rRNA pseudouridine synthase [Clostridia bacterium]|nr:rRNA pseudouridine synthase [Clostridia bacterium]